MANSVELHFHMYYHVRQVLKRLQTPLPHGPGFNATDNPYTSSEFFKIVRIIGFLMILEVQGRKILLELSVRCSLA